MIPDNVEKVIMTKEDYNRNVEQLLLEKLQLEQEFQRKDNVINELEKWLKYKKQQMKQFDLDKRKETGAYWYSTMGEIEEFLDKLNELRGK